MPVLVSQSCSSFLLGLFTVKSHFMQSKTFDISSNRIQMHSETRRASRWHIRVLRTVVYENHRRSQKAVRRASRFTSR